jgi:hypothetical protein
VKLEIQNLLAVTAIAVSLLGWRSADAQANNADLQPYVVYVARDGEFARCGPSDEYYKTDALRAAQEVEVYLETDDDWLGIRPPENSFCWIQSDQIEVADDEVTGTVVDSSAYSWIGTHLGRARKYSWQVRLDVGEQVTIIGTARRDGPDGDEFWYRIVPPPGEFRWVHRSQVVESRQDVEVARPTPLPNRAVATNPVTEPDGDADADASTSRRVDRRSPTESTTRQSVAAAGTGDSGPSGSDGSPGRSVANMEDVVGSGLAQRERPTPPPASESAREDLAIWGNGGAGGEYRESASVNAIRQASLDQPVDQAAPILKSVIPENQPYRAPDSIETADVETLRLELSRAMATDAKAIELEPIRLRCAALSGGAPDAVNRGRAALLLRRIEEYQRLVQQRNSEVAIGAPPSDTATPRAGDETSPIVAANFDRQGWLVKVYSARPGAPPYAVTDSAGRTLSYITPVPGINLQRYLNQEIGLYGRLAFDTSLETPHLIAEQAVRLRR